MITLLLIIDFIKEFADKYGYGVFIPIVLSAVFVVLMATAGIRHIIIPGIKNLFRIKPKNNIIPSEAMELIGFDALRNNIPMLMEEFEGLK